MAFSLRQTHKKNDIYLQIYENYWDKELRQPRNRHIESLGYVSDLISEDIPDPVVHFKAVVENMNRQRTEEFDEKTRPRAFSANVEKNVGYFLIHALIEELNVKVSEGVVRSVFVIGPDGRLLDAVYKAKPDTGAEDALALIKSLH